MFLDKIFSLVNEGALKSVFFSGLANSQFSQGRPQTLLMEGGQYLPPLVHFSPLSLNFLGNLANS